MNNAASAPVAYVMKRYPRLSETFILNEIRAMERLGARLQMFSLLAPEPPPHHPMVAEVSAPLNSLPVRILPKLAVLMRAHLAAIFSAPLAYGFAAWRACVWSVADASPIFVWKQFIRAGFVATSCRRAGVRHIHAHFANDPAQVAHFASLMSGIPFSVTAHAKDIYLTPKRVLRWRASEALFVATCTGYNARYLRGLLRSKDHGKIRLVYHGIDISTFAPSASAPSESPFLVLSVGRLVPKKGHDDLIAACALLRDAGHDFRCLIVGAGPEQPNLKALIDHHALESQVKLTGSMTHVELIELYRQAGLFALAPRIADDGDRDGIPNVIAEAMASGVPVVSTKISGIPELVRDQQTGILVPPNDPKALAAAIGSLITDPGRAARLARSARALVQQEFDLWSTTRQLHALLGCSGCHAASPTPATATATEAGALAAR
jgi:glycosyltransferase involved in cell wall biosynthesis